MTTSRRFATDASLKNGRWELPPHARGVLVLADPPEAGWRIQVPCEEHHAADGACAVEKRERA